MRSVDQLDEPSRGIVSVVIDELRRHLGDRLVSLVLYGSRARGTNRNDSDVDLLVVIDGAADSKLERYAEIEAPDTAIRERLWKRFGLLGAPYVSYVVKNRGQAAHHLPLYLDITEDAVLLVDANGYFAGVLEEMRERMRVLGSKRVWIGERWYWVLKPGMKWGEVVEI